MSEPTGVALAFVDTETTGLDPVLHDIWEVALILRQPDGTEAEHVWLLPVNLGAADSYALTIGRFYERWYEHMTTHPFTFAQEFARLTHGAHLVGAVPSFDDKRLERLLRSHGACPGWHYHIIDVEALAAGYMRALAKGMAIAGDITRYPGAVKARQNALPPWDSTDLSQAVGINPDSYDKHTALGDAQWARDIYDAVMTK